MNLNQEWFNEMIDQDNQILETYRELLLLIETSKKNNGFQLSFSLFLVSILCVKYFAYSINSFSNSGLSLSGTFL